MENRIDNGELHTYLVKELGDMYVDIIELEFNCTFKEFTEWFVKCDANGCYFVNI